MNGGKLFSKLITVPGVGGGGEELEQDSENTTEKESGGGRRRRRGGGGSPLFGPLTQGSIVLLGNEGTKETGGVHLILAGGRSLWSRETPARSFICCGVSLGRR